jgi:hypothetical protein
MGGRGGNQSDRSVSASEDLEILESEEETTEQAGGGRRRRELGPGGDRWGS